VQAKGERHGTSESTSPLGSASVEELSPITRVQPPTAGIDDRPPSAAPSGPSSSLAARLGAGRRVYRCPQAWRRVGADVDAVASEPKRTSKTSRPPHPDAP